MSLGIFDDLIVPERFNASAQYEKRGVDVSGFLLPLPGVHRLLDSLGARQVAETQH